MGRKSRSGFREQPALEVQTPDAACFFKLLDTELRRLTGREMELPPAEAISERGVAANHQSHSLPDVHPHACTRAQPAKWADMEFEDFGQDLQTAFVPEPPEPKREAPHEVLGRPLITLLSCCAENSNSEYH